MSLQIFLLAIFILIAAAGVYVAVHIGWLWGIISVVALGALALYMIASGATL